MSGGLQFVKYNLPRATIALATSVVLMIRIALDVIRTGNGSM